MRLKTVTITGIDERTNLVEVAAISRDYPFVEWGVLLSISKTGFEPRYPSLRRIHQLSELDIPKSVHLCGILARNTAAQSLNSAIMALTVCPNALRLQINLGKALANYKDIQEYITTAAWRLDVQVIIQSYDFTLPNLQAKYLNPKPLESNEDIGVAYLHDASGGRGIVGPFQKPVNGDFVGFAGGIDAENVAAKLAEIEALDFPNPFWIDMESGVRTDDYLDLSKVRRVLGIASPYIAEGGTPDEI